MGELSKADLDAALSDYRAAAVEAVEAARAWHAKLEAGATPSAAEVSEFHSLGASLNERVTQTWARYCYVSALAYRL